MHWDESMMTTDSQGDKCNMCSRGSGRRLLEENMKAYRVDEDVVKDRKGKYTNI